MRFIIAFIFIGIVNNSCNAQCNTELKNYAVPFNEININAFAFLESSLNNVRIVGFGEDTHGTAEFTTIAGNLMQYLSINKGFKIFVLETGFGEGQYLNDYIQGRTNDLKLVMNKHNQTWRYRTKSFYKMMHQLKEYNKTNKDKIYIYGCEMQYVLSDISRIKEYLIKVGSNFKIEAFNKFNVWQNFNEDEKADYYISYIKLKKYFIKNYQIFKEKTSQKETDIMFHQIEVLGQFVTAINQSVYQRKSDFREIYMGENIQWILNFHGNKSKALYWAHNAHVGDWVDNGNVDVTGHQLRKMYGNTYFNIATDFGSGEYIAYPADANKTGNWNFKTFEHKEVLKDNFSYCLQKMGKPNIFLNIRKARKNNQLSHFFNLEFTTMSGAGAQVRNSKTETKEIGKAFDAIIYLDKTNKIIWEN